MGWRNFHRAAGAAIAAALSLSACSAATQYTYVTDSADSAYFKVPPSWKPVDQRLLAAAQAQLLGSSPAGPAGGPLTWSRAYDAAAQPSASHIFGTVSQPVVYASVQAMNPAQQAGLSFDSMRNLLLPVTPLARQAAKKAGATFSGFQSIGDSVITSSGVRGVNELFGYDIGGMPEIFDQTVLTNSATTKLYLLLVQCNQSCFIAHRAQIATVVRSFTVRGS
ncbi:MAG TPA: hypothetical protein VK162_22965 [Streptosporangiaceae bacterium]|nr:hypothetical protein [Streptosporangiaceae bacterium]